MLEQMVFRAIADPTRRNILTMLSTGERSLNEISAAFEMTRPAVAKHIKVLEEGGLVQIRKQGRVRLHRLQPERLKTVSDWLSFFDHFWDEKLVDLKHAVEMDDE